MFGKKKKYQLSNIDTLIGQNTEVVGDVTFSQGLHVDGVIKGNVEAPAGSDAFLTLSDHGRVEGDVRVPNIILNGEVQGDVYASGRIELANKARIKGTVYYNLLEMAMGAEVNGSLVHQDEQQRPKLVDNAKNERASKLQAAE
ncbi:MAG TPA: polymer-forming cytoskeletal family protein [Gammaproteobacteria bacterium]|nr:polymer-forming cytoskeletal family protein [Gammaproteobacteria bacterium]